MTVESLVRVFSPRLAERLRIRRGGVHAQHKAYSGARDVCSIFGAAYVAETYGLPVDASFEEIARGYARACYCGTAQEAACAGALQGLREFEG